MGMLEWIRGFGERKRARIAEEERTLSPQDRAAIQSMRDARRGGLGDPKHGAHYIDPNKAFRKH
jgi:hypothetical protein